jgi:spore protease
VISSILKKLMCSCTNHAPSVLITGLGNRAITADSIGSFTADKVVATAHLNRSSPDFAALGLPSVSVIAPGVSSQTGMETADIIKSAAICANADIIIAIDALAARSTERLCTTIQLSDTGIEPGSGVGNHRRAITYKSMGVPVIALGVPTVVNSATLV